MMAVAAAGPISNFLLAGVGAVVLGVATAILGMPVPGEESLLYTALTMFLLINIFLGLFNLLPIPPFDGSHILGGLLPGKLHMQWEQLQRFGMVLILGVIGYSWIFGTGWLEVTVLPVVEWAMGFYLGLADTIARAFA
jgi:Zn-dependent protease